MTTGPAPASTVAADSPVSRASNAKVRVYGE